MSDKWAWDAERKCFFKGNMADRQWCLPENIVNVFTAEGFNDDKFYKKLLERLVLRFQGLRGYLGTENPHGIPKHDDLAVRTMIQMIAHAVLREVKELDAENSGEKFRHCPCGQRTVSVDASYDTKAAACPRCRMPAYAFTP